ncbi:hypothetical protein EYF80_046395 [Liparis tanakae]|uniref:Uncharacterized protein n=1 Tax=Liparis tanakae TaxID=230148 RepID=A0A4Z2FQ84_9TELE|nr:hypothetical protein EYF80_046395 [Liparis tanakae]
MSGEGGGLVSGKAVGLASPGPYSSTSTHSHSHPSSSNSSDSSSSHSTSTYSSHSSSSSVASLLHARLGATHRTPGREGQSKYPRGREAEAAAEGAGGPRKSTAKRSRVIITGPSEEERLNKEEDQEGRMTNEPVQLVVMLSRGLSNRIRDGLTDCSVSEAAANTEVLYQKDGGDVQHGLRPCRPSQCVGSNLASEAIHLLTPELHPDRMSWQDERTRHGELKRSV